LRKKHIGLYLLNVPALAARLLLLGAAPEPHGRLCRQEIFGSVMKEIPGRFGSIVKACVLNIKFDGSGYDKL
jgi:hypothetical protein